MVRTNLRQKIINELLHTDEISVKQLCELTGVSRVSVSKELAALVDAEIVSNAPSSRKYVPSPKIAFVIFKLYFEYAELVSYSLDGSLYTRERIDLLYSISHEDNIAFLLPRIKRHRELLKNSFERVFTFIIHDKRISPSRLAFDFFDCAERRAELISRHIEYSSDDESILYVNNVAPISFICQAGRPITPSARPTEKSLQSPQGAFSLIKPTLVLIEGKECAPLTNVCAKNNVPIKAVKPHKALSSDELCIIKEFLFSLSKLK